jgi:hypothetical protein
MHRYDLSDCYGETGHDGRSTGTTGARADPLLERLCVVHGCPRYDLPRELLKVFDLRKFAREYL